MRVTYMTSVNHTLAPNATVLLHAYNFAPNPRKPAQTLAFAHKTSRKFGLKKGPERRRAFAPLSLTQAQSSMPFPWIVAMTPNTTGFFGGEDASGGYGRGAWRESAEVVRTWSSCSGARLEARRNGVAWREARRRS